MSKKTTLSIFIFITFSFFTVVGTVYAQGLLSQALWVFPDTSIPNEVTDLSLRQLLVDRSANSGVDALYVSVFQSTPNPNAGNSRMFDYSHIADLITKAHDQGIEVWAAYG